MWEVSKKEIKQGQVCEYHITKDGAILSFQDVIGLWQNSKAFKTLFISVLRESEYQAYFWEVKPITAATLTKSFVFVLVNSSILSRIKADSSSFESYFKTEKMIVNFPNLRKDAHLVVPTNYSQVSNYPHLAQFIRHAPQNQVEKLWERVAVCYQQLIGEKPKWLSTAGLGVYWLHIRIDSRPKYYRYQPYKYVDLEQ